MQYNSGCAINEENDSLVHVEGFSSPINRLYDVNEPWNSQCVEIVDDFVAHHVRKVKSPESKKFYKETLLMADFRVHNSDMADPRQVLRKTVGKIKRGLVLFIIRESTSRLQLLEDMRK